ncbi:Uncharacterised protein [Mycobacteroides abscessus subsp. abscessus]|nr:Uncharacterised protein [Mycobacteroides abscessus subsp. abscessus]SHW79217.1 Uncharacterised protein [Mycobacteroides abscessus subsp. abscessus]SKO28405.1 Uncharacterised protein [Mycobacteroides abscessus subsp. abscessus]
MLAIGVPSGRVIPCTRETPRTLKMALATLFSTRKSAGFLRSLSVSINSTSGVRRDSEKCR